MKICVKGNKSNFSRLLSCIGLIVFIMLFAVGCGSSNEQQAAQENLTIQEENQSGENVATKAWGPKDRDTYTWGEKADIVTINSITDNPKIGDERNFVRIREAESGESYSDKVELEVGKQYEVSIWYDNNANSELNGENNDGIGIANDVRIRIETPEKVQAETNTVIKGFITSTNSNPKEVWDTAYAYSETEVILRYVANSATIHSNGDIDGEILSSEALFGSEGSKVGYWSDMWGTLPGGSDYSGYITLIFAVDQPGFSISATVAVEGERNYVEEIIAKPGDILDFHLLYKNTGTVNQKSIIAYDTLPEGLKYISGSSYFTASFNEDGNSVSDSIVGEGINLGDFKPDEWGMLIYRVQVEDDVNLFPLGDTVLYNNSSIATANGTGYDKVQITIHRD